MKKSLIILSCGIIISTSLTLTGCEKKDNISFNTKEKEKQIALSNEKDNILDLNIYFDSSSSNSVELSKEERIIKKDELLGETIINELIKGPSVKSKLKPILPKESRLLSFSIKDNIAYINLSKEANISMSVSKEETCLKSIVFSLIQLPSIEKVKILIENKDTELWGGHFDLSKPITKEYFNNLQQK